MTTTRREFLTTTSAAALTAGLAAGTVALDTAAATVTAAPIADPVLEFCMRMTEAAEDWHDAMAALLPAEAGDRVPPPGHVEALQKTAAVNLRLMATTPATTPRGAAAQLRLLIDGVTVDDPKDSDMYRLYHPSRESLALLETVIAALDAMPGGAGAGAS